METVRTTLVQGDARDILPGILDGVENPIIVSDPPFNIGYHYEGYADRMDEAEYWQMLASIFAMAPSVVVHYPEALHRLSIEMGRAPERVVSWVYPSNTRRQHRDIAFYGVSPDFSRVTQPYRNPNDKRVKALIAKGRLGAKLYDWWEVNQVKNVSHEKTAHPCQMPEEVMRRAVGVLPDGATIIDPFMGSGTTGVSAVRSGHDFIGIELNPEYLDIARGRIIEGIK